MNKQTQTQTSNVIGYPIHIEDVPLNGEEEENEQKINRKKTEETSNKLALK